MLRKLQIWHLTILFLIPVLYTLFRLASEPHDKGRISLEVALLVVSSIWGAFILIQTIITGKQDNIIPNVINVYRRQLTKYPFLFIGNIILSVVVCLLLYQLLMYRQVEFICNTDAVVYLNDTVGNNYKLGSVKANTPILIRLHIGERYIVFESAATGDVAATEPLIITPWWSDSKGVKVQRTFREGRDYEATEKREYQTTE